MLSGLMSTAHIQAAALLKLSCWDLDKGGTFAAARDCLMSGCTALGGLDSLEPEDGPGDGPLELVESPNWMPLCCDLRWDLMTVVVLPFLDSFLLHRLQMAWSLLSGSLVK